MEFYDNQDNVTAYIEMAEGHDSCALIEALQKHLAVGSTVLELGMGPGTDSALLSGHYCVTGSDRSRLFLDRYRQRHPNADLLYLDAVTVDTDRRFDAIYSNKVLCSLTKAELQHSFQAQVRVLNPPGIALHTFWYGEEVEEYAGLLFVYRTETSIREVVGGCFEILEIQRYAEMEPGDSLYVVLRKPAHA